MSRTRQLVVLIDGETAGMLEQDLTGRLHFGYESLRSGSTPLSLSMPVAAGRYGDRVVRPFIEGLLPDNERVLRRWRRELGVRSSDPFALLVEVGEEVAGGAQFVRPERAAAGLGGSVEWLSEEDIGQWLRNVATDPDAWHMSTAGPQWSLTGAQSKIALHFDGSRWGRPGGAIPTTHILKPPIRGYADHDVNEHVCLQLARRIGVAAARSRLQLFDKERALVVERYDRRHAGDRWLRIHQEDLCQALALRPTRKYQAEGGPGPRSIASLFRRSLPGDESRRLISDFLDQLAFHWLIAGPDAHAKNYSVLLSNESARLAPMYDVASALFYDEPDFRYESLQLAMSIGGQNRLRYIGARQWSRLAEDVELPRGHVLTRVGELAERFTSSIDDVIEECSRAPVPPESLDRLAGAFRAQGARCLAKLETGDTDLPPGFAPVGTGAPEVARRAEPERLRPRDRWVTSGHGRLSHRLSRQEDNEVLTACGSRLLARSAILTDQPVRPMCPRCSAAA